MMNKRMISILDFFIQNSGETTIKKISEQFEVDERTIRYDIDKINEELKDKNIVQIEKLSKGILTLNDYESISKKIFENFIEDLNIEYREIKILVKLLFNGKINITSLCDELNLGRTTIKNSLKEIKNILTIYKLDLNPNSQTGVELIGNEENIRRLQLKIFNQYRNSEDSIEKKYVSLEISKFYFPEDEKKIKKIIVYIVKNLNKIISDEAYNTLINYYLIMINRIRINHLIADETNQNYYLETKEYEILKKNTPLMETELNIEINEHELLKLTDYFLGSHSYNIIQSTYKNWIEMELLIKRVIINFDEIFGSCLIDDENLLDGLVNHIKPAIHRIKNKIELQNTICEEVKENIYDIFLATKKALEPIHDFIGEEFPDEEVAFIAIHFKISLEKNYLEKEKIKNVLIVCGLGYGTSQLLAHQIMEKYDVTIVDMIPLNQLNKYENENIDIIITTLSKESFKTKTPIVTVKTILTKDDLLELEKLNLSQHKNKILFSSLLNIVRESSDIKNEKLLIHKLKVLLNGMIVDDLKIEKYGLLDLLKIESIELDVEVETWQEALQEVGNILEKNGKTEKKYTVGMIEKVEKYGAYIVSSNKLALPHTDNNGTIKQTGMALLTLKNEVIFPGGDPVKILLGFCTKDGKEHLDALYEFFELIKHYDFLENLELKKSKKEIIDYIKKYEFLSKIGKSKI